MPTLFTPFKLKDIVLRNRIAVPPMCQYSAEDGLVTDWHQVHYASLARGGAGLVIVEATAISPEGRITPACTGIWNDAQAEGLASIAASIKAAGAVAGIQIGHAGRKASSNRPWEGDDHIPQTGERSWEPIAPSPLAFGGGWPRIPREMTQSDIALVQTQFVQAAQRACDAGFEWLELHFAHGFLAQSFLSQQSNQRIDRYGGSFENRSRFLLETLAAVREVWPEHLPLTARVGVIEFDGRDEETLAESIDLLRTMRRSGLDLVDVSMGFNTPDSDVPWGKEAFLLPVAERVRRETGLPVATSWGLDRPQTASKAISEEQVDVVMMGHAFLANPHYTLDLAQALGQPQPAALLPIHYAHWLRRYSRPTSC